MPAVSPTEIMALYCSIWAASHFENHALVFGLLSSPECCNLNRLRSRIIKCIIHWADCLEKRIPGTTGGGRGSPGGLSMARVGAIPGAKQRA